MILALLLKPGFVAGVHFKSTRKDHTAMQFAQGFARVATRSEELLSQLGPLKDLIGTWTGNKGFNLIAVPSGPKSFQLEVMPYMVGWAPGLRQPVKTLATVG
jgi:hypothetical protein